MAVLKTDKLAQKLREEISRQRAAIKGEVGIATIVAADDHATDSYILSQQRRAKAFNICYKVLRISAGSSQEECLEVIETLNQDHTIQGILIHKPFPSRWEEYAVASAVIPQKDIEGINPLNLGQIYYSKSTFLPPTVLSVLEILNHIGVTVRDKTVVLVGFSHIIGKPLALILGAQLATLSIAQISTYERGELPQYISQADIVITAVGKPQVIKGAWIKKGAIVIDVGMAMVGSKLTGDVEFETAAERASFITPVPGGVGPLTVLFLYKNLLNTFQKQ